MRRSRLFTAISALTGTLALIIAGGAVAAPAAAATPTVETIDFDDSSLGSWSQSGGGSGTLTHVPDGDGLALQVNERAGDYVGIQSAAGALTPGNRYTVSIKVKLAEGTPDTQARFVLKPDYSWGGNATVTANEWTTLTATYEPTDEAKTYQLYIGTADISGLTSYTYLLDDLTITTEDITPPSEGPEPGTVLIDSDFEAGLDGWGPRDSGSGAPTVALSDIAHGGVQSAIVSARTSQGSGIGHDATGLLQSGVTYELSAAVRFADGRPVDAVWLTLAETASGSTSYKTLAQFTGITNSGWTEVTAKFNATDSESALLYFETNYNGTNTSDFLIDDVVVKVPEPAAVEDLPSLAGTVDFPVGVAIDSRETAGSASELLLRHFTQITPENHMKPEAWYDAEGAFRIHPEATALMDFASENDLDLYGHVLVWHSQTPAWFFQDGSGQPLAADEAGKQVLRDRMREHIFDVAEALSGTWGAFGSDTNPLTAFDVVNEVVSDSGEFADGLRRSEWYRILGEEYIDLAFRYADEAFNGEFAAEGSDRPVSLFINDYNTEQDGKQNRYVALVDRLLARDVPIDGVGHQFHVSLAMPVSALAGALDRFEGLGLEQAVTEFDVTTGTPVTQALLVDQGYYYRDAFEVFRDHDLFSATVWGLTDNRSWRDSSGAPLLFGEDLKAKPAYYGAAGGELGDRLRAANVFGGAAPADPASPEWQRLPLHDLDGGGTFQARWNDATLAVLVDVPGGDAGTTVELELGDTIYTVRGDGTGTGDVPVDAVATGDGVRLVAQLPLGEAGEGDSVGFDVRVTGGGAWNSPGALGTLTLVEPLAFLEVIGTDDAPVIDGAVDDGLWDAANAVTTDVQVDGSGGATATVRTLWRDNLLYVLAEVADPQVDVTGSDPWVQDSVEIYVDPGNAKNGSYRYDDTQIRISAANVVSFGTGDTAYQQARVTSETSTVEGGYVVEAAVSLLEYGGEGTFHGLDFQVNDASNGARTGIRNWADPTAAGYQSTAHWGVGQLVAAPEAGPIDTTVTAAAVGATYGAKATLSAMVAPADATGTVSFRIAGEVVCEDEVEGGVATCAIDAPVPGSYTVTAAYNGDAGHKAGSATFGLTVAKGVFATKAPTISGTAAVGRTLTAKVSAWSPTATFAYQWLRDGKAIGGATKSTYVVTSSDNGRPLSVKVTGTRTHYATASATSTAVKVAAGALTKTPTPAIAGTAKVGKTLTAKAGTWAPAPVTLKYQWLSDGKKIAGATKASYTIRGADKGHRISVTVTGGKTGYASVSKTSKTTDKVAVGTFSGPTPKISGWAKSGKHLKVQPGTWSPRPSQIAYQWLRDGTAIKGATGASYKLGTADQGHRITVRVTGSATGYATLTRTSGAVTVAR
ncbi:endo-1,4-beta-xylanase [Microbacterium rhizophilus]|uniref:endo-1,4-beta-xylanase n=1 Tax=Microbacterium rhizophilus TaxID=3138934 RepID=UPI0031ED1047